MSLSVSVRPHDILWQWPKFDPSKQFVTGVLFPVMTSSISTYES